jgi:hypothetical protein
MFALELIYGVVFQIVLFGFLLFVPAWDEHTAFHSVDECA